MEIALEKKNEQNKGFFVGVVMFTTQLVMLQLQQSCAHIKPTLLRISAPPPSQ